MRTSTLYDRYSARATAAGRARAAQFKDLGYSPYGKLWTEEEEYSLRLHYPDYSLLQKCLTGRTKLAIVSRAAKMKLAVKARNLWSVDEMAVLRSHYRTLPLEELISKLPGRTILSIRGKASRMKIERAPPIFKKTGQNSYYKLRLYCYQKKYTMRDLDEMLCVNRFRTKGRFRQNPKLVRRAIEALGGKLFPDGRVRWTE